MRRSGHQARQGRPVVTHVTDNPIQEITEDRERARAAADPLADVCYLVTVASPERAEARALTLRDITDEGFGILINRTSPKWKQLSATDTATLLIHWPTVRRQYRIWGGITPMDASRVNVYWARKNLGSKLLEYYYTTFAPQSHRIASRTEFLAGIEELRRRYPDRDAVPRPESLAGIYVAPREIEVWHGSEERLHDRRLFQRSDAGWIGHTLVP
jgi:pyridoxamine 5'-phosphate oxidase